jgi:RNA polymerase sigma-70 factor (ECF subfamily)
MNEQSIVQAPPLILADDPVERLASLFDVHYDRLYRLARRLAPSADDALDLVQETFLKAARFPKSIPVGATNEEAWLVRVLINICRDQWRKTSVRDRHDKAEFGVSHSASAGGDPETALIARAAIWQALNVLPPRRRAIVVMYELEGLAIPAIASLLGISAITVRWHLSMGRRDLTRALKA